MFIFFKKQINMNAPILLFPYENGWFLITFLGSPKVAIFTTTSEGLRIQLKIIKQMSKC